MPHLERAQNVRPLSPSLFAEPRATNNWLTEYEKRQDSIFRYYSIENEVDFLKKSSELPYDKRLYYLDENVKRFLGEFVGKIPYTTIPYEIDGAGFSYAQMHVMDSYRTAARLGGEREKAETDGFERIESEFKKDNSAISGAFWISPPKNWDYGFIFIFEKEGDGKVKERILRYDEKMGKLKKSSELFAHISGDGPPPSDTDAYLRHPIFAATDGSRDNLESVMRIIGIDERKITESRLFEEQIDARLGIWIRKYSSIVNSLTLTEQGSPLYERGVIEAKKIMLTIYQQAEKLKDEVSAYSPYMEPLTPRFLPSEPLDQQVLYASTNQLMSNTLPTAVGGSCPSIKKDSPLANVVISNNDILRSLTRGLPAEQLVREKKSNDTLYCTCPFCNKKVLAKIAQGKITCPKCGESAPYAC